MLYRQYVHILRVGAFGPRPRSISLATVSSWRPDVKSRLYWYLGAAILLPSIAILTFANNESLRHSSIATQRCLRIGKAVIVSMLDYKKTRSQMNSSTDARELYSACHIRSANRILRALLANGGIYIKLGQHVSTLVVIPREWRDTLRPLQDKCEPTPYEDMLRLFESDTGQDVSSVFVEFSPEPIGVASLAQVHVGRLRDSGELVAVKLQHPHLDEFTRIDMKTVEVMLDWVKYWFPEFEFTWLAEEMRENLPREMDFTVEAKNAYKTIQDFSGMRTSLYVPLVKLAKKRVLIMEYIQGGRIDDKMYFSEHSIDRNKVALELERIFSQMVHINGWFHADPHPGNLLIRPSPPGSRSPYNFEIVLLDHGLYFDLDPLLRVNYSKMWLSLISSDSPRARAERVKYAELVGNIGPELYPVFESAITGRVKLEDDSTSHQQVASIIDTMPQSDKEKQAIINAIMNRGGLIQAIFDLLRKVPRRVLMVLKLNDLTRNLDKALDTTHSEARIFIVLARYCSLAVWIDEKQRIWRQLCNWGSSRPSLLIDLAKAYWDYHRIWTGFRFVEWWMDSVGTFRKKQAWLFAFSTGGLKSARLAAAGVL